MADVELVRIDVGFHGGDVLSVRVPSGDADALDAALRGRADAVVVELHAEDGHILIVLAKVSYVKRYAREARVGFAN